MDIEARRKYCGLLMFGSPNISKTSTSRNNDIIISNMSSVDSSFESRSMDHQFVMQDGFESTALAAGAAAGGDSNQESLEASNAVDNDAGNSKAQPPKRTPRPPNAFILYRREKQPGIIASQRNLTNAEVSRTISDMWKREPEEVRLQWERFADRKKLEHMQTYPNYVYRPNKNKSKVDKRRSTRKSTASKESTSSSNNNSIENKLRKKPTKSASVKPPTKLDLPLMNMAGFNMSQTNSSPSSYATILPSPEMPLLTAHFTDNPEEFVSSHGPITPITPHTPLTPISTPPEHEFKLLRLEDLTYQQQQQQQQHSQSNQGQFPFYADPFFLVPDVARQHQQIYDEMMLHHEPHHLTPSATVPSSTQASTVQYYPNGGFTEMLGFEFPNFLGGSVNHDGNGLATDQYLQ